jgi:hypothetical protein
MALAVSAGVVVVALAYALFALVRPYVGPAGGAAIVALAAAILIALLGLMLGAMARPPKRKVEEPESLIDRVVEFVRARPVTAVAGALAAGLMAVRNPRYLGAVLRAFVEGRTVRDRPRR